MDIGENFFEMQIHHEESLLFAYKTSRDGSMLFTESQGIIRRSRQSGMVPVISMGLTRDGSGQFSWQASADLSEQLVSLADSSRALFDSPYLKTPEGAIEMMVYTMQSGRLPGPIVEGSSGTRNLPLQKLDLRNPELPVSWAINLNNSGQLLGLTADKLSLQNLRYGKKDSVSLNPPKWPDVEVVSSESFDTGYFLGVLGSLVELFTASEHKSGAPF